jgi:choline dehydrogenase-like flavoprotein
VVFQHGGNEKVARVNSEVVLAAGTVGTAKLLLLSGIGPRTHLQGLKVLVTALSLTSLVWLNKLALSLSLSLSLSL